MRPALFLCLAAVCACVNLYDRARLGFNGAYLDESDYLFVGRLLLGGGSWPSREYIFSSDLPLLLLGVGERLGGLHGARAVNGLLGLASLLFYHDIVRRKCAGGGGLLPLASTLLLCLSAQHTFLSKFATYDMLCATAFAAGSWALVRAEQEAGARAQVWGMLASLGFTLALLSKYVIVLELVPVGIYILVLRRQLVPAIALPCFGVMAAYALHNWSGLLGLYHGQIVTAHAANATAGQLLLIVAQYTAALLVLGTCSALVAWRAPARSRLFQVALWCCVFALPVPLYHLHSSDRIALYKHTLYPVAFLAPVAAYALVRGLEQRRFAVLSSLAIVGFLCLSRMQLSAMEHAFPDTRGVAAALPAGGERGFSILSEDGFLFRYLLGDRIDSARFFEVAWLDNDGDGKRTPRDVVEAVWDGKFRYVYLDGQLAPELVRALRGKVLGRHYERVYAQRYRVSGVVGSVREGTMELYRRVGRYEGRWPLVPDDS